MSDRKEKVRKSGADRKNKTVTPSTKPSDRIKEVEKPQTLSDMLAEQRKAVVKEKTDAAKMQKYYALTDAFNALGKMGGAAIGGAIGGSVLDSAPAVAEYQPSRGYMVAFEEAKRANERLRSFDDKSFQLALRAEDRSYKQQMDKLNRDWQKQMIDYKNQLDRANADKDFERSRKFKEDFAALEHKHDMELQRLKNQHRASEQAGSRANMQFQYDLYNKPVQIAFDDGTALEVSENEYKGLFNYLNGKTIGGKVVNKDNIGAVIRENPRIVNDYLNMFGGASNKTSSTAAKKPAATASASKTTSAPAASTPVNQTGYAATVDSDNQWRSEQPKNLVDAEPEEIGFDIFSYERK